MAGCVPCFIIPLILFIFHRYLQPILLKFWNPWNKPSLKSGEEDKNCTFDCDCSWNRKKEVKETLEKSAEVVTEDKKDL